MLRIMLRITNGLLVRRHHLLAWHRRWVTWGQTSGLVQRCLRSSLRGKALAQLLVVSFLGGGIEQTPGRCRHLLQQLLRQGDMLARLLRLQVRNLAICPLLNHLGVRFEQRHPQQPIVMRRLLSLRNA